MTVGELVAWIGVCGLRPADIAGENPLTAPYVNPKNPDLLIPESIITLIKDIIRQSLGREPPEPDEFPKTDDRSPKSLEEEPEDPGTTPGRTGSR